MYVCWGERTDGITEVHMAIHKVNSDCCGDQGTKSRNGIHGQSFKFQCLDIDWVAIVRRQGVYCLRKTLCSASRQHSIIRQDTCLDCVLESVREWGVEKTFIQKFSLCLTAIEVGYRIIFKIEDLQESELAINSTQAVCQWSLNPDSKSSSETRLELARG